MAGRQFAAKPLSEPVLTQCKLDITQLNLDKMQWFLFTKMHLNKNIACKMAAILSPYSVQTSPSSSSSPL